MKQYWIESGGRGRGTLTALVFIASINHIAVILILEYCQTHNSLLRESSMMVKNKEKNNYNESISAVNYIQISSQTDGAACDILIQANSLFYSIKN